MTYYPDIKGVLQYLANLLVLFARSFFSTTNNFEVHIIYCLGFFDIVFLHKSKLYLWVGGVGGPHESLKNFRSKTVQLWPNPHKLN